MGSEWETYAFSELCDIKRGASPRPIHDWLVSTGVPWVKISDASAAHSRFIEETACFIKPEGKKKSVEVHPGDLILSNSATPGIPKFLSIEACIHDGWLLLRNFKGLHKMYAYYLLLHERPKLLLQGNGSVFTNLKTDILKNHMVPLPPLEKQKTIASILGTLDDKIELNRKKSETLETMARALFKSWFVDFDPVRAKMEGRWKQGESLPGMPADLWKLFPDMLVDSELGEIPEGWELSIIGEKADTLLGGTPSRKEDSYWDGDVPWINSGKANEFRIIEPSEYITLTGLHSSSTKLLPSRTTVIAITGATLGQVSLTEISTCANQSIVGVLGNKLLPSEYLYFWIRENIDELLASKTGGAQQHINKNNVNDLSVICPSPAVVDTYLRFSKPVFDRIRTNCFECKVLSVLRDTLLPKLISGELRVNDAEKFLSKAGV